MNNYAFLGIVQGGRFVPLAAEHPDVARSLRLTTLPEHGQESPETGDISLIAYEGSAIMVRGIDGGDWVYSAVIVEQADSILTAVVQHLFDLSERKELHRLVPRLG